MREADLGPEILPLGVHPSRQRLFSRSQDSSLAVFIRVSCYTSFCASSMCNTSWVEYRHWLFCWITSHSLLAVQLLCLTMAAQFNPEANATHDTQLSVAWNGVSASKAAQSLVVVLSNRSCSLLNIKGHGVNSLTCIKVSAPAVGLAPRVWHVLYQQMVFKVTFTEVFDSLVFFYCIWLHFWFLPFP